MDLHFWTADNGKRIINHKIRIQIEKNLLFEFLGNILHQRASVEAVKMLSIYEKR